MKSIASILFAFCISFAFAQSHKTAIAFPIDHIEIDGNLLDWPTDIAKQKIENVAFGQVTDSLDLSAEFMVAYNLQQSKFYVAIQVQDSEYNSDNLTKDINLVDRVLLYLDPIHDQYIGSSVIFEANEYYKEYAGKPEAWNPFLKGVDWSIAELAVSKSEELITYEWSFDLGESLQENNVIGFDLIIADVDKDEETWMLWKPGTGKSETGFRLGEIILAKHQDLVGTVKGSVVIDKEHQHVSSLKVVSAENPKLWLRTPIDSNGNFEVDLPFASYKLEPFVQFSSPMFSGGFNQKTRKVALGQEKKFTLKSKSKKIKSALEIIEEPIPTGYIEEKGVLFADEVDESKIDHFVNTYQQYFKIPGVSIALIKDKKLMYSKAFGVKNNLTQEALQKASLFEAASITKPVFTMIVLKMAELGEIDLDKPLFNYLAFPNLEKDPYYKLITARHVLNHRSGLTNWPLGSYSGFIPETEVSLAFKPGEEYQYSGEGMNYLGRVVEKIKGKPLHEIFKEEIKPAFNLENTYFHFSEDLEDHMALGHYHNVPFYKYKFDNINSPASSLISEANDFSNFVIGLMNRKYLSDSSYELFYNIHKEMEDNQKMYDQNLRQGIGHGFFVTESPLGNIVAHGGNNGDYDCLFLMIPEKELGFVVFTNSNLGDEFNRLLSLFLVQGRSSSAFEF